MDNIIQNMKQVVVSVFEFQIFILATFWGGLLVSKISVLAKILAKIWPKFGQNRLFSAKIKCFLAKIKYLGQNKTGFGQNKNDFGQNFCEQNQ